jgi:hypothetical protein
MLTTAIWTLWFAVLWLSLPGLFAWQDTIKDPHKAAVSWTTGAMSLTAFAIIATRAVNS